MVVVVVLVGVVVVVVVHVSWFNMIHVFHVDTVIMPTMIGFFSEG